MAEIGCCYKWTSRRQLKDGIRKCLALSKGYKTEWVLLAPIWLENDIPSNTGYIGCKWCDTQYGDTVKNLIAIAAKFNKSLALVIYRTVRRCK